MTRSKRYTENGLPRHIPIAYTSLAEHMIQVAEGTSQQLYEKDTEKRGVHSTLSWLCIMLGPSFEQEVVRLQRKLAPGREL